MDKGEPVTLEQHVAELWDAYKQAPHEKQKRIAAMYDSALSRLQETR
jgi:hypothetical protein